MEKFPDFWSVLFGEGARGLFFGYCALSFIAAAGITLYMASQKYKTASKTPDKWSWKYFWINNGGNFIASLFVLPLFIRILIEFVSEPRIMLLLSIGLGFGFYRLAKLANKFGIWTTEEVSERLSEKIKSKNENNETADKG